MVVIIMLLLLFFRSIILPGQNRILAFIKLHLQFLDFLEFLRPTFSLLKDKSCLFGIGIEIELNMSFEPIVHIGFYACGKPFDAHSKPRENGLSMTIIQMCIYLNVRVC